MRTAMALVLTIFLPAITGNALPAAAECTLDQQQPLIDPSAPFAGIGGVSNQKLAQVFTAGERGELCEIQLVVESSSGALSIAIHDTDSGAPGNTVLASMTVPEASIPSYAPGPPVFRSFTFPAPPTLTAGTQYAIVLIAEGEADAPGIPYGDNYTGGDGYFIAEPNDPDTWVCICDFPEAQIDLPFKTFIEMDPVQIENSTWGGVKHGYR